MRTTPLAMRALDPSGQPSTVARRLERATQFLGCAATLGVCSIAGCAPSRVPEPDAAIEAYRVAIAERDVDQLWEMLTKASRSGLTKGDLAQLLEAQHEELLARSRRLAQESGAVRQRAQLFLADGAQVELSLEQGEFRVEGGAGLPSHATDPVDAVRQLRAAVRSRDFRRARAALSQRGQERVDAFFSGLESALEEAEWGVLEIRGQRAELSLPSGRSVRLRKEEGVWKVEEVE